MPKYVPVNYATFASRGWRKVPSYAFAARQSVVPVVLEELPHVLPITPLAFVQQPEESGESGYQLVAVMSPAPQLNLFVAPDGRWLGGYVPAAFRAYPFRLIEVKADDTSHVLCFDEESGLLTQAGAPGSEPFFVDGSPTAVVEKIMQFLTAQQQGRALAQQAVALLAEHGVIEPWALNIKISEADTLPVAGLFRINEAALKALDGAALKALQEGNALSLAYAQLYSQQRLGNFDRLYQLRQQLLQSTSENQEPQQAAGIMGIPVDRDQ